MKVLLRADASQRLGGGHLMRCLALADELAARGWSCTFVCSEKSAEIVPQLRAGPHRLQTIPAGRGADPTLLPEADLLVVDHYELGPEYESAARGRVSRVLVIDDLPRHHDCDLLLDQTLGRTADEWRPWLRHSDVRIFAGTDYALLRPSFATLRPPTAPDRNGIARVLVSFGATDAAALCAPAARAACDAGVARVDVAVGAGCPHLDALRLLAAERPAIHLHVDADMARLGAAADLALGAAGSSAWERCCLGLPTLMAVIAQNQVDIARSLEEAGAVRIVPCGQTPEEARSAFAAALGALQKAPEDLAAMSRTAYTLCDGQGARRTASLLTDIAVKP